MPLTIAYQCCQVPSLMVREREGDTLYNCTLLVTHWNKGLSSLHYWCCTYTN